MKQTTAFSQVTGSWKMNVQSVQACNRLLASWAEKHWGLPMALLWAVPVCLPVLILWISLLSGTLSGLAVLLLFSVFLFRTVNRLRSQVLTGAEERTAEQIRQLQQDWPGLQNGGTILRTFQITETEICISESGSCTPLQDYTDMIITKDYVILVSLQGQHRSVCMDRNSLSEQDLAFLKKNSAIPAAEKRRTRLAAASLLGGLAVYGCVWLLFPGTRTPSAGELITGITALWLYALFCCRPLLDPAFRRQLLKLHTVFLVISALLFWILPFTSGADNNAFHGNSSQVQDFPEEVKPTWDIPAASPDLPQEQEPAAWQKSAGPVDPALEAEGLQAVFAFLYPDLDPSAAELTFNAKGETVLEAQTENGRMRLQMDAGHSNPGALQIVYKVCDSSDYDTMLELEDYVWLPETRQVLTLEQLLNEN